MPIFIFLFGLLLGSFLNALLWRLWSGKSIFAESSECPRCHHKLAWADLVPVLSFFLLGRKCRYCNKPISWSYPAVELATALAFTLVYFHSGLSLTTYYLLLTTCFLIIIFVYDLKHYLILDKVLLPAAILALVYQTYRGYQGDRGALGNALIGALALAGFFALLYLASRGRWIGLGDVKLGLFLGLLVPWPQTVVLFFLAYFLGAAISVPLLLLKQKHFRDRLPFGTFLTAAAFVAMLYGETIMNWYLHLIGVM